MNSVNKAQDCEHSQNISDHHMAVVNKGTLHEQYEQCEYSQNISDHHMAIVSKGTQSDCVAHEQCGC